LRNHVRKLIPSDLPRNAPIAVMGALPEPGEGSGPYSINSWGYFMDMKVAQAAVARALKEGAERVTIKTPQGDKMTVRPDTLVRLPGLILHLINGGRWRYVKHPKTGEPHNCKTFVDYLESHFDAYRGPESFVFLLGAAGTRDSDAAAMAFLQETAPTIRARRGVG
jgi:hypothetical protein